MKKLNIMKKLVAYVAVVFIVLSTACVDEVHFGDSFLEKASGSTVTIDTVFSNAEYTKQFLTTLYAFQYYGLPYVNSYSSQGEPYQESNDIYVGKPCMLTDIYATNYSFGLKTSYLEGSHTSNYGNRADKWHYINNRVWEAIRYGWLLIENVYSVPDLDTETADQYVAEAKCCIVTRYFDVFRNYGGIPIIDHAYSGTESSYEMPRGTVEECTEFMIGLLDEAIEVLPWQPEDPNSDTGRWTKAGAMALKCRILQFVASPLFNDDEPYHSAAASNYAVWLGGYSDEWWNKCLTACEEFFTELNANGYYELYQASGTRPEDYRLAYRSAYALQASTEILHSVRHFTTDAYKSAYYVWHQWMSPTDDENSGGGQINRAYYPTFEYMCMFPWADGSPFDWDEAVADDSVKNVIFGYMDFDGSSPSYFNQTRDPRMYEEMWCNGMPHSLDWTTGNMSGVFLECWVGGTHATTSSQLQSGKFASGFGLMKYVMGDDYLRKYTQWVTLRLSDLYLIYAEALAQTGNLTKAIEQVDIVRARVGLGGLDDCNPDLNLTSDKDALIEEILRERACELGMEDTRFFDLIRYKRADIFETPVHALLIYRMLDGERNTDQWYGLNAKKRKAYPTEFEYETAEWTASTRYWWSNGFDPKWYFSPFPMTEINKGYGLVQNPGW